MILIQPRTEPVILTLRVHMYLSHKSELKAKSEMLHSVVLLLHLQVQSKKSHEIEHWGIGMSSSLLFDRSLYSFVCG